MGKKGFKTIASSVTVEVIEKKSRFICTLIPITEEEQALNLIAQKRSEYWDASHHCYAYILGNQHVMRYSDDGEPSGTAGQPMLNVLQKEELINVATVVTRYFGGTLLGAGGLVRAYSKSVSETVKAAEVLTFYDCKRVHLKVDYTLLGKIQNELHAKGMLLDETVYTERVELILWLPVDEVEKFLSQMIELTNGQIESSVGEAAWIGVDSKGNVRKQTENT